ncbi:MAG: hypothetical protein ACYDCO_21800 [Armatimonadota bacterium]
MPGFDPLGFRATDWRAVGLAVLVMVIVLPLVVAAICFSGTVLSNPASYTTPLYCLANNKVVWCP